ncbi:MAG: menaquinone reductase molybdopterin-binding-like subunit QrcB [Desulfobacterales bacterium]
MKLSRRCFLSFAIGAAAGINLTPLPWKLTDDLSIWTQTWPWTPVPRDGKYSYENTICTLCPGGCGISVRKVDHRAVKIEGMKDHPVNNGGICILGASGLQYLYGPFRVQTPMKRTGERGEGHWKSISWEEAFTEVSQKLAEIRSSGEPEKLAAISGNKEGTVARLLERFLTVYGSPNFMTPSTVEDSYEAAIHLMQGSKDSVGVDFENADFVLSFGSGILEGWGSPVQVFQAIGKLKKSGKVVQIEPRLSHTAAKSDRWIPIKPGTEGAMVMGIAHVIIREKLYVKNFIDTATNGFKTYQKLVMEDYSPEQVAEITGVTVSQIVEVAREFAESSKPVAICGRGEGRIPGNLHEVMAVLALNALVGNINTEGGFWTVPKPNYIKWPAPELDKTALAGLKKGRIDGAGSPEYPHTKSLLDRFPKVINEENSYGIEALLVSNANPLFTMPDTEAVKKAFAKIPYIVSFSSFMDETAQFADILLPNPIYLERYEDVCSAAMFKKPILSLAKPVVAPQHNTMHTGDVIIKLAKSFGGDIADAFSWKDYQACLKETLGEQWELLKKQVVKVDKDYAPNPWAYESQTGKFEFVATEVNKSADEKTGVPHYEDMGIEAEAGNFILIPYDTMPLSTGYAASTPFMLKIVSDKTLYHKDTVVQINPKTALELGLKEGSYAELATSVGSVRVKVTLYDGIMPNVIAMPSGLGHTAYDDYMGNGKGVNINQVLGTVEDPVTGLNAAWGIRAKLTKA